jgi:hypothetical protein
MVVLAIAGCGGSTSETPTLSICVGLHTALVASIRDAQTGLFAASNATVIASLDASYADTFHVAGSEPDSSRAYVANRPGTYVLTIRKSGYMDWTRSGVVVPHSKLPCDADPVTTTIEALISRNQ